MYWSLADARLAVNAMAKRKIRTPQKILEKRCRFLIFHLLDSIVVGF
jgi:hypothetical protein